MSLFDPHLGPAVGSWDHRPVPPPPPARHRVLNSAGAPCVVDRSDPDPLTRLVTVTGYWCPACHLPRVPYAGDDGLHPWCADRQEEQAVGPALAAT